MPKKRRGPSSVETGGLWEKVLSIAAASAITIGSVVSPAAASRNIVIYTWVNGNPFVFEDVSLRSPSYHSIFVGKDIPRGYYYSMHAAGHLLPDGTRNVGYIPVGTKYCMKLAGHMMPYGVKHSGLVTDEDYEKLKHGFFLAEDVARHDITKPYGGQIPWPVRPVADRFPEEAEAYRRACEERRQENKEHKARIARERVRRVEIKEKEGIKEVDLFRFYFNFIGENCVIHPYNMNNQTVGLYVFFPDDPNFVIAWYDKKSMNKHSEEDLRCKISREEYIKQLNHYRRCIDIILFEISDTTIEGIVNGLGEATARRGHSPAKTDFLSEVRERRDYILGPAK